jgi:hypothetical protein
MSRNYNTIHTKGGGMTPPILYRRINLMTNTMSDDREWLLNGDWIVYNDRVDENFDLPGSKIAILTGKQRDKMDFYNVELERIRDLETYDLRTLVRFAIENGFVVADRTRYSGPQREVFVVTFPLLERPGQTFAVVLDHGDGMRGCTEEDAKDDVLPEFEDRDDEEADDYPKDINIDWDHVTCARMTAAEAEEATKSSVNPLWWR